ncbi:hypothetical protein [Jeotgalicoccus psychrophilus]|uniref:hypothetical protein n=1 Tax=Jeotgalicoccus psychrophilus TaxID=157228 RepID=UPI0003F5A449|nr:hypothetical protein [Jeotgalicoccus psychrophilus]
MEKVKFWQRAWEIGFITGKSKAMDEYVEHISDVMNEMELAEEPAALDLVNKVIFRLKIDSQSNKTQGLSLTETMLGEKYSEGNIDKEMLSKLIKDNK